MDAVNGTISLYSIAFVLILLITQERSALRKKAGVAQSRVMLFTSLTMLTANALAMLVFRRNAVMFIVLRMLAFASFFAVMALYTYFLALWLKLRTRFARGITIASWVVCLLAILIGMAITAGHLGFDDDDQAASFSPTLYLAASIASTIVAILDVLLLRTVRGKIPKDDWLFMTLAPVAPCISVIFTLLFPGLLLNYPIFVLVLFVGQLRQQRKGDEALREKQQEADMYQLRMVRERVEPHFVCNVLANIYYLCDEDAGAAKTAVTNLSDYLRGMAPAKEIAKPVPFSQELSLIRSFIALVKLRSDEKLLYVENLEVTNFSLPSFTVQPLVENAVKHGYNPKTGLYRVELNTARDGKDILITVIDYGKGFDKTQLESMQRPSGTNNLRQILELTGSGEMSLDSIPGLGTVAKVRLYGEPRTQDRSELPAQRSGEGRPAARPGAGLPRGAEARPSARAELGARHGGEAASSRLLTGASRNGESRAANRVVTNPSRYLTNHTQNSLKKNQIVTDK